MLDISDLIWLPDKGTFFMYLKRYSFVYFFFVIFRPFVHVHQKVRFCEHAFFSIPQKERFFTFSKTSIKYLKFMSMYNVYIFINP